MTLPKKAVFSLILSGLLASGIILLANSNVNTGFSAFSRPEVTVVFFCMFFTLFLAVFFIFNIRQHPMTILHGRLKDMQIYFIELMYERYGKMDWNSWYGDYQKWQKEIHRDLKNIPGIKRDYSVYGIWNDMLSFFKNNEKALPDESADIDIFNEPESPDAVGDNQNIADDKVPLRSGGLLAAAASFVKNTSPVDEPEKLEELESVPVTGQFPPGNDSCIKDADGINDDAVPPSQKNPGLLKSAENRKSVNPGDVIFEQNGIHYINSGVLNNETVAGGKLDNNFVKLVESVFKKT